MRWPWSKPQPTEAARTLGKLSAEKRAEANRAKIRAKADEMCRAMNRPLIDWANLKRENTNV